MFTATFYPDANPSAPIVLCNTTRALAEIALTFNHQRVTDKVQGYGAPFGTAIDRGNVRNTISFDVRRSQNDTPAAFVDAGAAFLYALQHPAEIPGTGNLQLVVPTNGGTTTIWLLNCEIARFEVPDFLGVAPLFRYTFNGGQITTSTPSPL
jgi:hypothetical protein